MTTKTISGTYSAGYVLNGAFSIVDITSAGSVGGFGLITNATATVQNHGHLQATSGAKGLTLGTGGGQVDNYAGAVIAGGQASLASGAGAAGHAGGAGAYLTVYGLIAANSGLIAGGAGGAGVAGTIGGVGGLGGAGASFHAGGYVLNGGAGVVLGGAGGAAGADQVLQDGGAAHGGMGGAGVAEAAYGYIYNAALIAGGVGGQGAYDKDLAGNGGAGGAGIAFSQSGRLVVYGGTVRGGAGGVGGGAPASDGTGGRGGAAGAGVVFGGAADLFNTGVIAGGAAGAGGAADQAGLGGYGGDGIDLLAGGTIINGGAILGGDATGSFGFAGSGVLVEGAATIVNGSAGDTTAAIRAGANGGGFQTGIFDEAGVQLTVTNFGTIAGAFAAVNFGSANDALIAEAGSVFGGEVLGAGLLELGAGSGTVSGIGTYGYVTVTGFLGASSTTVMQGFAALEIAAGGSFQVASGGTIAAGRTLIADGVVTDGAGLTVAGTVTGAGSLVVDGKLTFHGKSALSVAEIVLGAKAAKVTVDANLVYAGLWNQTTGALTIDASHTLNFTGSNEAIQGGSLTNEGKLESSGPCHLLIFAPLANDGALIANGGTITLENAASVTGSGDALISGGKLIALGAFDQAVTFKAAGTLVLEDSQAYTGAISGFSKLGTTFLDFGDIGFVSAGEATFSGTTTGGVLTVTDGTHTARISLSGNYRSSTFVCASDGLNGVLIQDPTQGAPAPPGQTHALVAAMASLGAGAPVASHSMAGLVDHPVTLLAAPR